MRTHGTEPQMPLSGGLARVKEKAVWFSSFMRGSRGSMKNIFAGSRLQTSRSALAGITVATALMLWSGIAGATITQGDFSIFGNFRTQWASRWGEGSDRNGEGHPPVTRGLTGTVVSPSSHTGGSFDFNRWDLVEAKMLADLRPDYH